MKRNLVLLIIVTSVLGFSGVAGAYLGKIGTAGYDSNNDGVSESYNLIYEGELGSHGLVWLDYTRGNWGQDFYTQTAWAAALGNSLTVTLDPGYTNTIQWNTGWRLPIRDDSKTNPDGGWGYAGPDETGYHNYSYGYNVVSSEMGHLYYESLGNKGYFAKDGTHPQPGFGLLNTGDFDNLLADWYMSGSELSTNPDMMWVFSFYDGGEDFDHKWWDYRALAVRPGEVSAVPEAGTVLLLASGLGALGAFGKGARGRRG